MLSVHILDLMACTMSFTMLLKRYTCIPLVLLYLDISATVVYAQENQKQRHEGHHHKSHIPEQRWDVWSEWSPCSVDCGTGITTRSRDCRSMFDGTISERCRGKREEIKICETTGCIKQVEHSCRVLEQRVYGGKRYRWIPYKHPSRECEMACRPVGAGFYLGLGRNVSDGTPCGDEESKVCVSGQCVSVGCDGVVESEAEVDMCGVCGGHGDTCTRVHKTFSDNVRFGYHTIATVPRGSTKIFIRDNRNSRNYLAVKATDGSFQINTAYRLSRFGDHPGAGTLFTYNRNTGPDCPDECISAEGPTDVSVDIMMLAYRDNDGIEYSYSVPTSYREFDLSEEESPEVYIDGGRVPGVNEASVNSVNGDIKRPIFSYDFKFKKNNKDPVHAKHEVETTATNPAHHQHAVDSKETTLDTGQNRADSQTTTKPTTTVATTTAAVTTPLPTATTTTISADVIFEEEITGVDDSNETITIETGDVEDFANRTDALHSPQSGVITDDADMDVADMYNNDNRIPSLYSWTVSGYTTCSETCGQGKQTAILECIVTDKKVKVEDTYCSDVEKPIVAVKACTFGPCPPSWRPAPWSKCSVSCGTGYQTRIYTCIRTDGEQVSSYECGSNSGRQEERSCDMGSCTSGWYFSEWADTCPVTCGYGTVSRRIHCFSDTGNERTACPEREKPQGDQSCRNDNCGAFWLAGPWSECNATCGVAYQNREIACAAKRHGRINVVSESACVDEEKPPTYMSCDFIPCEPEWYMNEWSKCSVTCGTGLMTRDIRCLDEKFQPATGCDVTKRPTAREPCTQRRCPLADESRPTESTDKATPAPPAPSPPRKEENTSSSGCTDQFPQCTMVLQARLCQYKYYQKICCGTCELVNSRKNG